MNRWHWLIVLGLWLVLVGPSRADVDLSRTYVLRPGNAARYEVTQSGVAASSPRSWQGAA